MKRDVIELVQEQEDEALLRAFQKSGSETAFRELVRRHLGMVLGAVMRRIGDRALAEEVAQNVFAALAFKASRLSAKPSLAAWLYRSTMLECSEVMRSEKSRKRKMDSFSNYALVDSEGQSVWREALPVLDEAIDALPTPDRDMIFLRFFERRNFQQIGSVLGKSEDAAQKQCERALAKLSRLLRQKGVTVPVGVLAASLAAKVAHAVPAGLTVTISQSAVAGASALSAKTLILQTLEIMAQATTKAVAAVIVAAAIPIAIQWHHNNRLQDEIAMLHARSEVSPVIQESGSRIEDLPLAARAGTSRSTTGSVQTQGSDPTSDDSLNASSLAAEWQRALFERDPVLRAQRIAELLASLTADMAPSVAGIFEQAKQSGIRFGEEYRLFMRAWGKLDGAQAMEHAVQQAGGPKSTPELLATLAGWATANPYHARAWIDALAEGGAKEGLIYGLLDGWSMSDFASAAAYAESRPRSQSRDQFRELLLQRALASGGVAAAQQWFQSIPDDEHNQIYKRRAFDDVIQAMLYRDPSAAAHWIAQNAGQPFLNGKAVAETAAKLAQTAPVETLNWLQSLPGISEPQWSASAAEVVKVWAKQDPHSAGNWLNQQAQHPSYDRLATQYARAIAGEHPQAALAWAQSIADDGVRAGTEVATARVYIEREGDTGKQALLAAGHSQDTIDRAGTRETAILSYLKLAGQADAVLSDYPVEYGEQMEGFQPVKLRLPRAMEAVIPSALLPDEDPEMVLDFLPRALEAGSSR